MMTLKDRFFAFVVAIVIAVSLFAGLVVIVDNVQATPLRPVAAIRPPVAVASEHVVQPMF